MLLRAPSGGTYKRAYIQSREREMGGWSGGWAYGRGSRSGWVKINSVCIRFQYHRCGGYQASEIGERRREEEGASKLCNISSCTDAVPAVFAAASPTTLVFKNLCTILWVVCIVLYNKVYAFVERAPAATSLVIWSYGRV